MSQTPSRDFGATRALLRRLRALGDEPIHAPASLLPVTRARLGLDAAPGAPRDSSSDQYATLETPVGTVFVAFTAHGISAVMQAADGSAFEAAYRARFGRPARPVAALPTSLARTVRARLEGSSRAMPRFDLAGRSAFERAVLEKALEIPRGEVRTYTWIAREIGRPRAVRAVGSALGRNPIPVLIPCHRVVRSDSRIGDYALGIEAKRALLRWEGAEPDRLETLARQGVRYLGSATTRIFCFPTCRHARRIQERHQIGFGSTRAATAAGYRPCKVCRPAA